VTFQPLIRVFLVDDSAVARTLLRQALDGFEGVHVVGSAKSGAEALELLPRAEVDVILMDLVMPGMDGFETTETLMATHARPILIVSELARRDAHLSFRALAAGALDVIPKPTADELRDDARRRALVRKLRLLAGVPVVTRHRRRVSDGAPRDPEPAAPAPRVAPELVCIGASTGGPPALLRVLEEVRSPLRCPLLIVQHMAVGFIGEMARWLADATQLPVELARDGQPLERRVYLAPDDHHMTIRGGRLRLEGGAPIAGHCPSVDALFRSVAEQAHGPKVVAALLTGMGADGARGLLELRRAGAVTLAQDAATSAVFGMPKVALDLGAVDDVLPLDEIARRIAAYAEDRERPIRTQSGGG
jgi:two-component system, chemotaxis family, protein-glutamate methylesterase/glutaminase